MNDSKTELVDDNQKINKKAGIDKIPILIFVAVVLVIISSIAAVVYLVDRANQGEVDESLQQKEPQILKIANNYDFIAPIGWVDVSDDYANTYGGDIVFLTPVDEVENSDGFAENINVIVQEVGEVDLEGYLEVTLEQVEDLATSSGEVNSAKVTLSGLDAYELAYDFNGNSILQRFAIKGGYAYLITYTGLDEYDLYLDDVNSFFDKFIIK